MLKKILFLIIIITMSGFIYNYFAPSFFYNSDVVYIEADKNQYKFKPTDKEGKSFHGDSLKIYEITREKLLPNNENKIKINNDSKNLSTIENKEKKIVGEIQELKNNIYLQLGAYKTVDKANKFVQNFKETNSKLIQNLNFNITSANLKERGTYYRIRLGPFNNNKDIYSLCIDLKLVNNECLIVKGK